MRTFLTTATTLFLTACGGGGGSDTSVSPGGGSTNDALTESDIKYLAASLNLLKITASSAFLARASNQDEAQPNQEAPCPISGTYIYREPNGGRPYSELSSCVIAQAPSLTFTGLGIASGSYTVNGSVLGSSIQYSVSGGALSGSIGNPGQSIALDANLRDIAVTAGSGSVFGIESSLYRGNQEGASPAETYVGDFTSRYSFDGIDGIVASTTTAIRWAANSAPAQGALSLSYRDSSEVRNFTFSFNGGGDISATNDNTNKQSSLNWTDPNFQKFLSSTLR